MITLYAISPINRIRIPVGRVDLRENVAVFDITKERYFVEADACGPDLKNYNQKSVQYCKFIQFNLWDGRRFRIEKEDFEKHCWQYPPGRKEDYKANRGVFKPKLMITAENLEKLAEKLKQKTKENRDLEMLKIAMS